MLHYMGSRQPPRAYKPAPGKIQIPPKAYVCQICQNRVWTPELFQKLLQSSAEIERVTHGYCITSHDLRSSALSGCKFCHSLADGINGRVFLDELYIRLQDDVDDDEKSPTTESSVGNSGEQGAGLDSLSGTSAFNEAEMDKDVTGGWDAWDDRDTLDEEVEFAVSMAFERGKEGLFAFLNVHLETNCGNDVKNISRALATMRGEDMVELRYYLSKETCDLADAKLFPASRASKQLGSDANMNMVSRWIRNFRSKDMDTNQDKGQLPARLIYIKDGDSLQIIETAMLQPDQRAFAALSYVWGYNQTFTLTNKSKTLLQSPFSLQQLPQTIQDAVTVTRAAGLSYLWVDAMCIMQDSPTDKTRELPKMRSIYKHSTFTIVASIATNASDGFLHHVTAEDYFIEPIFISNFSPKPHSQLVLSYPSSYNRRRDPINSRAWTFQELILSTRSVSFSYRGITLTDRSAPSTPNSSHVDPQLPNLPWNGSVFSLTQTQENIRTTWLVARDEYTRRNLTWAGDRLLAIAGVAEEISQSYKSRYLAGLWERDLVDDLKWQCFPTLNREKRPRSDMYVAPSWSWASVDGAVEGKVALDELDECDSDESIYEELGFEVVACNVELVDKTFEFGAVKGGELVVKGRLRMVIWRPYESFSSNIGDMDGCVVIRSKEKSGEWEVGEATIDAVDCEVVDGVEVACLAIHMTSHVIEGLMLLPVDDTKWRRVGFINLKFSELYDDVEPEQIVIV